MKGSIPLPYIVALILAIAVIVVVGYMFLSQSKDFSNILEKKYCEAKLFGYCAKPVKERGEFDIRCKEVLQITGDPCE